MSSTRIILKIKILEKKVARLKNKNNFEVIFKRTKIEK